MTLQKEVSNLREGHTCAFKTIENLQIRVLNI